MRYIPPRGSLDANGLVADEQLYRSGVASDFFTTDIEAIIQRESAGKTLDPNRGKEKKWVLGNTLDEFNEWARDYLLDGLGLTPEERERLERRTQTKIDYSGKKAALQTIQDRFNHLGGILRASPDQDSVYNDLVGHSAAQMIFGYAQLEQSHIK